jgi:hypothetical protein
MTDDNSVDIWQGLPPLPMGKPWTRLPVAKPLALKMLVTVGLLVALGGCVSTRQGDYENPFVPGSQGVDPGTR